MLLAKKHILFVAILSAFFTCSSGLGSDAFIQAGSGNGQGFLFERESTCYLATPKHVVNDNKLFSFLLANRREYEAELVKVFASDLAVLKVSDKNACRLKQPEATVDLGALLKIYDEGVLKTKLPDASTQQTKVSIRLHDDGDYLYIRAENSNDVLKQGYSGSVLYVANEPAGILLSVDDDNDGEVLRQDAIDRELVGFFGPGVGDKAVDDARPVFTTGTLKDEIDAGKGIQHEVSWEENSPIHFKHDKKTTRFGFTVSILRQDGKSIFSQKVDTAYDLDFVFTPPKSENYIIQVTGTSGSGTYNLELNQYAMDADLRNASNIIDIGDKLETVMAQGTVAEYFHAGNKNSPIKFYFPKQDRRHQYTFSIVDDKNKDLFARKIDTAYEYEFAYTPLTSEPLKIRLIGQINHGHVEINIEQYAFDAELKGAANIVEAGDSLSLQIAAEAVAEYKYAGQENSPIKFYLPKQELRQQYQFAVINDKGKEAFTKKIDTAYEYEFAFTPPTTGVYVLRLTGLNGHGSINVATSQYALDADLRGMANTIDVGDVRDLVLAAGSTAEFHYEGLINSPVVLYLPKQELRQQFNFSIVDESGKDLFLKKIDTAYDYEFAFTPLIDAPVTVKLAGLNGHGDVKFSMDQLALDSELRGVANVLEVGGEITAKIAKDAIAEYQFNGLENQKIGLYLPKTDLRHQYTLTIHGPGEQELLTKKIDTAYEYSLEFNPPSTSKYTLRFVGLNGHGSFSVNLN